MSERPKIDIGLDDEGEGASVPRPRRQIDREAIRSISKGHGFDRPTAVAAQVSTPPPPRQAIDGRTLRATGRSTQMNAKVTADVREGYQRLALARGHVTIGELLEEGLALLRAKYPER